MKKLTTILRTSKNVKLFWSLSKNKQTSTYLVLSKVDVLFTTVVNVIIAL